MTSWTDRKSGQTHNCCTLFVVIQAQAHYEERHSSLSSRIQRFSISFSHPNHHHHHQQQQSTVWDQKRVWSQSTYNTPVHNIATYTVGIVSLPHPHYTCILCCYWRVNAGLDGHMQSPQAWLRCKSVWCTVYVLLVTYRRPDHVR